MSIKLKIQEDLKNALKTKEELKSSVLRLLLSSVHNREIEKKTKLRKAGELKEEEIEKEGQLSDEEIIETISSEIKKRKETILEFEKGKRLQPDLHPAREKHILDLIEKEKKEMEILEKYLPEQLTEEELRKLVKEVIEEIGVKDLKDMGRVMGQLMPKVKGRAEGTLVSKIVKEFLILK